ncbi:uncharacterized protein LOC128664312 [Bombina bombina]|uniref:uncharacterized protein LOC128664312 n=1 Tax=Bombina bombina TaxID=8345 RepID=UPI00235A69AB|nr:uncharacterized protein LOC128664312 [Bombina bombina]
MEAAESLIGHLISLKEEVSRASKSRLSDGNQIPVIDETNIQPMATGPEQNLHSHQVEPKTHSTQQTSEGAGEATQKSNNDKSMRDRDRQCSVYGISSQEHEHKDQGDEHGDSAISTGQLTREVSWEMHPECSRGCSNARRLESNGELHMGGAVKSYSQLHCGTEERPKIHDCKEREEPGFKRTESSEIATQGEDDRAKKGKLTDQRTLKNEGDSSIKREQATNILSKEMDTEKAENHQLILTHSEESKVDSSVAQRLGGEDGAAPTKQVDDSSEEGSVEQGCTDKLAITFLEAAENLIGGLIPGTEEGLTTVRKVVVIVTDSSVEEDHLLIHDEELSNESVMVTTQEGSSAGDSQSSLVPKDDEGREDTSEAEGSHEQDLKLHKGCVLSGNHADIWEEVLSQKHVDIMSSVSETSEVTKTHMRGKDNVNCGLCEFEGPVEQSQRKTQCKDGHGCREFDIQLTGNVEMNADMNLQECMEGKAMGGKNCIYKEGHENNGTVKGEREKIEELKRDESGHNEKPPDQEIEKRGIGESNNLENEITSGEHAPTNQGYEGGDQTTHMVERSERGDPLAQAEGGKHDGDFLSQKFAGDGNFIRSKEQETQRELEMMVT